MSIFRKGVLLAAFVAATPVVASADETENSQLATGSESASAAADAQDLQRIPGATPNEDVPPGPSDYPQGRLYVEDAATAWSRRSPLVPVPGQVSVPDWQNRTSLDGRYDWSPTKGLDFTISDRFNVLEQNDIDFVSNHTFRNDFREGYVTWQPMLDSTVEVGRVNVKEGVALGFNPTDFFKTRTLVDQVSQDPSVLREDRLGTAMVRVQHVWDGSSVNVAFAPKLVSPSGIDFGLQPAFNPSFGQTNDHYRVLVTASHDFGYDLAPQILVYHEATETKFGANITHAVGNSVIAYAEWAGGRQLDLIDSAVQFGEATGALTPAAVGPFASQGKSFMNDLTVGASWSPTAKTMFNLEYIFHQAGFSKSDWNNWFNTGTSVPSAAAALWYVRLYALDQEEPISEHQIFIRGSWADAFVRNLQLGAFAFVDLLDGSTQGQVSASYNLSDAWTLGALVGASLGAPRSDFGSVPQSVSGILQVVHYF